MRHFDLDTQLTFGKHTGWTIEDVIQLDPEYVDWMKREFKDDEFDEEISKALWRAMNKN